MLTGDLLDELEGQWRRQRAPLAAGLRPGLTDQDIDDLTAPLEIRLPREARMWWQWHDGAGSTGGLAVDRELGPGLAFYSLREAVELCRQMRDMFRDIWAADGPEVVDYWWRPTWFPISERRGAIRCDCAVADDQPTPIYWAYSHDHDAEGLTKPRVDSFGTMVRWWIDALETGAWSYDTDAHRWAHNPELVPAARERSGLV
jgi:cell wall assembly regulator SMI1